MNVLLVDDERTILRVLSEILQDLGHTVTCRTRGREALQTALNEPCDLIITDLRMPGMDGLELIRSLREQALAVPVILTTASGGDQPASMALQAGALACLPKPVRVRDVVAIIRSLETQEHPKTTTCD